MTASQRLRKAWWQSVFRLLLVAGAAALLAEHPAPPARREHPLVQPVAGVPETEVRRFAAEDPAVKAGLLRAEVRPWLIGMRRSPSP